MSKPEVVACPFCGAEPLMREIEPHTHSGPLKALGIPDHPGSHVIECGCGAGMIAESKDAVRAMWNRREMYSYVETRAGVPDVVGYASDRALSVLGRSGRAQASISNAQTETCREPLIRLTDHEAAIAERDAAIEDFSGTAVQNGMECDRLKARIQELEAVLSRAAAWIEKLPIPTKGACAQLARIDAALAQQGKEGDDVTSV